MAYQMMERGQIKSLDDPFQVYAPDFDVKNPFGNSKITIRLASRHLTVHLTLTGARRQMLSQLSGLPREAPCLYGSISTCNSTTAEIYDNLKNESLIFPPWVVPSYRCSLSHLNAESEFLSYANIVISALLCLATV